MESLGSGHRVCLVVVFVRSLYRCQAFQWCYVPGPTGACYILSPRPATAVRELIAFTMGVECLHRKPAFRGAQRHRKQTMSSTPNHSKMLSGRLKRVKTHSIT